MSAVSYWTVNVLGIRGLPYLSRSIDKATMLDDLVEALTRKAEYTNRFWMHATYKPTGDATKDKAFEDKLLAFLRSAAPGEAQVTAEDVEINVLAPDLKIVDTKPSMSWCWTTSSAPREFAIMGSRPTMRSLTASRSRNQQ